MPRSAGGAYTTPPGTDAVSAASISSTTYNTLLDDLESELTDSWSRSGKGAALADLDMGSHKLTNLAAATVATDAVRLGQITGVFQPLDADLTTWAGLTPSADAQSLVTAANFAAMRVLLGLVIGTNVQAFDAQLFSNIPVVSKSADYTLVLTDGEKQIYHPDADTTARTFTIPANASVAFPVGTAVTFNNGHGAGVITIAITSDTLRLANAGTTGNRSLAADGIATAVKRTSTEWIISGTGLT